MKRYRMSRATRRLAREIATCVVPDDARRLYVVFRGMAPSSSSMREFLRAAVLVLNRPVNSVEIRLIASINGVPFADEYMKTSGTKGLTWRQENE
jgi:hypothetical protein